MTDANLQASEVALELLVWDRARATGRIEAEEAARVESLIHRGALQYRRLLDSIHGERESAPIGEGRNWLQESAGLRNGYDDMTDRGLLRFGNRLRVTEEDIEQLDRKHPERSFTGSAPGQEPGAGGAAPGEDLVERLERLGALHAAGQLTDEEFAIAKRRLLNER